ncbi:chaperonin 10-like protein [Dactylonectria macrodidyma]|uniref:Chaperonin 10-like protein n=1 Tax=Dactylonectria macrodidyma TaxID=307937 RepID=A0A9P9DTM6_9HYPO|nr:chaperonin 10-like protein [Dactylonectria macrodidyma]
MSTPQRPSDHMTLPTTSNGHADSGCNTDSNSAIPVPRGQCQPYPLPDTGIPSTQSAVITAEVGPRLDLQLKSIPVRKPEVGQAIVEILYTGICRSDVCFSIGPEPGYPRYNHITGHEGIGHVVYCHDPALLGRPVAIRFLASACESCTYCLRGLQTSCPHQMNTTKDINGTFQRYATFPVSCLLPLPEGLIDEGTPVARYCAALCSGSAALRALRDGQTQAGDVLVVVGIAGGIGHLVGTIAKHVLGLKVIGVDRQWKVDSLTAEQADRMAHTFLPTPEEHNDSETNTSIFRSTLLESCMRLRGSIGVPRCAETVIVAASEIGAFRHLEDYVCDGGRIICLGVPRGDNTLSIPLPALVERSLHVSGSLMGGRKEALEMLQLIKSGQVEPLLTEISLSDVPDYMERLQKGMVSGKVVVCVSGGNLDKV